MKASIRILAAACSLLGAGALHAQSPGNFVDASNRVVDLTVGGAAIGGAYEQVLAQTITVEFGGRIDGFYLPVSCDTEELRLEIRDVVGGLPGQQVLDSQVVPAAQLPGSASTFGQFRFIPFYGGRKVSAGDQIALVLSNPKGVCGIAKSTFTANYGGGRSYYDTRPNPVGVWTATPCPGPDDLPFILILV